MPNGDVTPESLTEAIERLKKLIRDNRVVEFNETSTRNALIDKLLEALGWSSLVFQCTPSTSSISRNTSINVPVLINTPSLAVWITPSTGLMTGGR